MIVTEG